MAGSKIPVCPLMSAGSDIPIVCTQENCAWYLTNVKRCAVFMIGHNAMIEIKKKLERNEG